MGRTGSPVGFGYLLGFVLQVGKGVFLGLHGGVRVARYRSGIVGIDGDHRIAERCILGIEFNDAAFVGLGIRTSIAGKYHDVASGGLVIGQRHHFAIDIFQLEISSLIADFVAIGGGVQHEAAQQQGKAKGEEGQGFFHCAVGLLSDY